MERRLSEIAIKRPSLTVLTVILVTVIMTYGLSKVSMTTEFKEFLPSESPAVITTEEFENKFGSATELILVRGENVLEPRVFRAMLDLENLIKTEIDNYVANTTSYASLLAEGIPGVIDETPDSSLELIITSAFSGQQAPRMKGFVNDNRTVALITVSTSPGMSKDERNKKTETFVKLVMEFDENRDEVELEVTGDLVVSNEIYGLMNRDNKVLIPAAAVLVLVILILTFKRFSDIGISLLTVGLSALYAVGTMGLLEMKFTMIHVALIPLILGLGIDYSIHMLNRYYEELGKNGSCKKAVSSSIRTTGLAVVLAALTTIIGFGSFMASELPAIGTLGVFAGLGIGFSFLLATCFLPAVLVLRGDRPREIKKAERGRTIDRVLGKAAGASETHGKFLVCAAVLVTLLCAFWASDVSTEMSFKTFLPSDVPSMVALDHLSDEFGGRYVMVVLVHGDCRDPKALHDIFMVENAAAERSEIITGTLSIAGTVKTMAQQIYGDVPLENLTEEQIDSLIALIENEELSKLVKDNTSVIYFYINAKTDKEMARASGVVRDVIMEENRAVEMTVKGKPAVGGLPVIIGDISESISSGMMRTTIISILLCLLVIVLALKSAVLGIIALMPLVLTMVWEFGALKFMGWSLDILTMGISSLVIGVGIDYGIHIVHRFLEERRKGGERAASVHLAVTHVGRAIAAAAATTVGVFGVLALSRMPAVARFGTLTALLILFAFIAAILVMPSMLSLWTKRKEGRG